jgi:DNA polymerase I-like protein with 3'-5' exonuclease and polymerase domains
MVSIEKHFRKKFPQQMNENSVHARPAYMVMQLHDELIYEVKEEYINDVKAIVKECMECCMDLPVRMKIKMKIGKSWGSLTPV